jgi:hypothetical protein
VARKHLVNMLQVIGITGLSQATSNALIASGNSQEFYEFASADAVRFYLDITAITGTGTPTIVFELDERDPATGVFFPSLDMGTRGSTVNTTLWSTGGFTTAQAAVTFDIDPCRAESYQVKWTVTGSTPSLTCSLVALLIHRD